MFLFSIVALIGGLLSVLSPCSGALLPTYFALTFKSREKLVLNTLFFSWGVLFVSIPIGIGAHFLFFLLSNWGTVIFQTVGLLFFVIGVTTLLDIKLFKFVSTPSFDKNQGYFATFIFGSISAFSLGACSGPILGAIATLAASTKSYLSSSILMFFYTLGILLPFIAISFGIDRSKFLQKIFVKGKIIEFSLFNKRFNIHSSNLVSASIFIFVGVIFLFFNGSLLNVERLLNINTDIMIQWQENLLDILNYYKL